MKRPFITSVLVLLGSSVGALMAFAMPDIVRIPRLNRGAAASLPNARFSHRSHSQYQCYTCHPSMFPQMQLSFTHADIDLGKYCGRCHNSKAAPKVGAYACQECHAP